MRGFQFNIIGSARSNCDFHRGYRFMTTVNFALIVVLPRMLINMSCSAPREASPLVVAIPMAQIFLRSDRLGISSGPGVMAPCIAIAAFEL